MKETEKQTKKNITEIKEDIDDILYHIYESFGTAEEVNEYGFNQGHYIVDEISDKIEEYFNNIELEKAIPSIGTLIFIYKSGENLQ